MKADKICHVDLSKCKKMSHFSEFMLKYLAK